MNDPLPQAALRNDMPGIQPEAGFSPEMQMLLAQQLMEAFPGPVMLWEYPAPRRPILLQLNTTARQWNAGTVTPGCGPEQFLSHTPALITAIYQALENNAVGPLSLEGWPDNSGKKRGLLVRFIPIGPTLILNTIQEITDFQGIAHYIDERKQAEIKLQTQTQELRTRNEELNIFTIAIAHELKNELTFVVALAEFLESEAENISRKIILEHASTIAYHGRKMGRVIKELQLLIDVREKRIEMKPLDMQQIVEETLHRLESQLKSTRARIKLPTSWPKALGYGPWVEEIWFNYISNALKYGGNPPHIELGSLTQTDGRLQFWVKDHGPGLKPEEQQKLFTPFPDLRPHNTEDNEVHGLGLYIVRFIAEKLGGQTGAESQLNQGSRFYFVLPPA